MSLEATIKNIGRMPWETVTDEKSGDVFLRKSLHVDEDTQMVVQYLRYPKGVVEGPHKYKSDYGIYVLDGQIQTDGELYGKGSFIWYSKGYTADRGATQHEEASVLLISNGGYEIDSNTTNDSKKKVIDVYSMPWYFRATSTDGKFFGKKGLITEEEAGQQINYMDYPAGFTTYKHTHPCGHGFFVLSGQLSTMNQTFGEGSFVWYPEGYVAEHGATAYEDLICLQITNKEFSIRYEE